jgi:hypothetical protein
VFSSKESLADERAPAEGSSAEVEGSAMASAFDKTSEISKFGRDSDV